MEFLIQEDGQLIGRLIYKSLSEPPEQFHGREIGSLYQAQALKLAKHFRQAKFDCGGREKQS